MTDDYAKRLVASDREYWDDMYVDDWFNMFYTKDEDMDNEMTFNQACYEIANEVVELLIRKHKDYGNNLKEFGEFGILVRVSDKVARLKNLIDKEALNEKKVDTWSDIAGYAILALLLERGLFECPVK